MILLRSAALLVHFALPQVCIAEDDVAASVEVHVPQAMQLRGPVMQRRDLQWIHSCEVLDQLQRLRMAEADARCSLRRWIVTNEAGLLYIHTSLHGLQCKLAMGSMPGSSVTAALVSAFLHSTSTSHAGLVRGSVAVLLYMALQQYIPGGLTGQMRW